jgi:Flp pilus assembly pilin Flp
VILIKKTFLKLVADESGQDLIEYGLMAGFVAVAAGAIMFVVSDNLKVLFAKMAGNDVSFVMRPVNKVQLICAAIAALLLGVIVLRRRKIKE